MIEGHADPADNQDKKQQGAGYIYETSHLLFDFYQAAVRKLASAKKFINALPGND
jgi:hypothetical protein